MPDYEQSISLHADADTVLRFISDVSNLPKYVPTTKAAQPQGEGRVRVQGEANHHAYDSDGYLRCDEQARRLEWGSDEGHYSGWMQVVPEGGTMSSFLTVHISFKDQPPGRQSGQGPTDAEINGSLTKALLSIQNHVQNSGGKVEPPAAT